MKSKRALWLAFGACCVGFVVMSCSSSDSNDGGSTPLDKGGESAGGDAGDKGGSGTSSAGKSAGGSDAQGGNGDEPTAGTASTTEGGMPGAGGNSDLGFGGDVSGLGGDTGTPGVGGDGAGGQPAVTETECSKAADCADGQICLKSQGCDLPGVCAAPTKTGAVCGCDGVSYYTGALASAAGVDVAGSGQCTKGAVACSAKVPCKGGLTCGALSGARTSCLSKVASVCWALPQTCPTERNSYHNCSTDKCSGMCEAIKSGQHAVLGTAACTLK